MDADDRAPTPAPALEDRVAELERAWLAATAAAAPADGTLHAIVVRTGGGRHATPARAALSIDDGVAGDRWRDDPKRVAGAQVSLIERRVVELVTARAPQAALPLPGAAPRLDVPGDNLVVDLDLSVAALPVGARLGAGAVVLEITDVPHLGCAKFRARLGDAAFHWVNAPARRDRRLRGVYARVVAGGELAVGARLVRIG